MRRHLLFAACTAAWFQGHGQRYFFENIGNQQGLPAAKVYCVAQSPDGIIWIGTETGLASYDGINVADHGPATGAATGGVRSLIIGTDGRIWAGHMEGQLTWSDGRRFVACSVNDGLHSPVTALAFDRQGQLWLATMGEGLWRITDGPGADGRVKAERIGQGAVKDRILTMHALADGRLAVVEDGGGLKVVEDGRVSILALPGVPDVFTRTAVFQDSKGALWVGTQGGGAFRCDATTGRCSTFDVPAGMRSNTVICFGEDGDGNVWIGTLDGGAACVSPAGLRVFGVHNGLHSPFVRCLLRDREGNMLIGTNESGLDIFKGDRFISYGEADGLDDPKVFAVMEDRNGRTWFGTNAGIVVLDGDGRVVERITSQKGQLTSNFIRSLREDDKGYVWIGTENGGLLRYDPRSGRAIDAVEVSGSLAERKVTALETGQPGEIWVGGLNGLRRYVPGSGSVPTVYTEAEGLAGNHVLAIHRDGGGTIWVGSTLNGVTRIDNGRAQRLDLGRSFAASCFAQDGDGRIWVGTEGLGIIVLQGDREVQRFTTEHGLLSNTIKALGTDGGGNVWIGTTKGLNKWRRTIGSFAAFTERAGFTGIEVKSNAVCSLRSGAILFGTVDGATRVGPEQDGGEGVPPLISIRGWKVNMEDRPLEAGATLPHTDRSVRIAFGSVALSDPGAVRYRYMLGGLDEDWQPVTAGTDAYYPALPPGSYTFRVKAIDRNGEWSEPAVLAFTILPPWYRSWWFYTVLALAVGASLFSYIKVRERQLRARNMMLERKVAERTAEVVAQSREIEGQKQRIEDLLLNILPKEISEELKEKGKATARRHEQVTVLFTDMKGFTQVAERMTPEELVSELDDCFIRFDKIIGRYGIEKIKTIGDSYMCAAGVPTQDPWHAHKCVLAALEIRDLMERWRREHGSAGKTPWQVRIGVHTGPVVAGVVGRRKFAYDIWGDTVNTASRMESSGETGQVNISSTTFGLVSGHFECEHRGEVQAKNKGAIAMYFVRRIQPAYSADAEGRTPNAAFLSSMGVALSAEQLA